MFCGAGSFPREDEDPAPSPSPPGKSPTRRKSSSRNPYSARGLDKFSTVLAELQSRRQKIMAQACAQGACDCTVRFVYTNSKDWVPVVINLRDPIRQSEGLKGEAKKPKSPTAPPPHHHHQQQRPGTAKAGMEEVVAAEPVVAKKAVTKRSSLKVRRSCAGGVCFWWAALLVVVLLCLALFGRTFAICCTSMLWYLVPAVRGYPGGQRRSTDKRGTYMGRRMSDKKLQGMASSTPRRHQIRAK